MAIWQAFVDGLSILSENWTVVLGAVIVTCLGCGLSLLSSENTLPRKSLLLPSVFFGISIILRLALLTEAFVPPYFDSVEHYRIIKNILTALKASSLLETVPSLTPNYYHLGFHFLASFLAFSLHANPIDMILALGQVILAAVPLPIFFLIRRETQSDAAALFGMLLAGFGWYMPGFAVNWGKYPALAGLLALEIVLAIAYFVARKKSSKNQPLYIGLLLLGIILSALFHTRTLVIIAISVLSWLVSGRLRTFSKTTQYLLLGTSLLGILISGVQIWQEPVLQLALDPYLGDGLWVTLTVVLLSLFALIKFPRGFYLSIFFILGVFAALFIPIGIRLPGIENQTLLDRPFAEMVLYLPLSVLAGLGLAGILQTINNFNSIPERIRLYGRVLITILLVGLVGFLPIASYNFYPSYCCNFVKYDDTVALDWMDGNLPPDAHILVAASELNVLSAGPSTNLVGTDAGIWIPALTGRSISLARADTDFRSVSALEQLCRKQVEYIYVGSTSQKFNNAQLNEKAEWYDRLLSLSNVQLYQLTGCK